nr:MAG TPA: Rubrerythrin, zinc-substituted, diiron four-helix bundle.75A [Caudoviricetes sp.]
MNTNMLEYLERTEQGKGDAVTCLNCEWEGLVPVTAETCPCCGMEGALVFTLEDDNLHIQEGTVYVPVER